MGNSVQHNPSRPAKQVTPATPPQDEGRTGISFEKGNVKYQEEGDFVEFCLADGMPAIGLLLALYDNDLAIVQWMCEQKEIDETLLRTLEQKHGVSLLAIEIFLTNKLSLAQS